MTPTRCTFCGAEILGARLDTQGLGTCHCGAEGRAMREATSADALDAVEAYEAANPIARRDREALAAEEDRASALEMGVAAWLDQPITESSYPCQPFTTAPTAVGPLLLGRGAGKSYAMKLMLDQRIGQWFRDHPDSGEMRIWDGSQGKVITVERPTPPS